MDLCVKCNSENTVLACEHLYCSDCLVSLATSSFYKDPYSPVSCTLCTSLISKPILYKAFGGMEIYSMVHNGYEKADCSLCYTEKRLNTFTNLLCDHLFCSDCLKQYVESSISSLSYELTINCPECNDPIDDNILKSLISKNEFFLYKKVQKARNSSTKKKANQIFRWCPQCEACNIFEKETGSVTCRKCLKKFCFRCKKDLHEGYCDFVDYESDQKKAGQSCGKVFLDMNAAMCPICKNAVELHGGCNAIKCPWVECGNTIFCVLCGDVLDVNCI